MRWCVRTFRELTAAIISCCEHGMFLQQRGNPQAAPSSARRWPWTANTQCRSNGTTGHLSRERPSRVPPDPKGPLPVRRLDLPVVRVVNGGPHCTALRPPCLWPERAVASMMASRGGHDEVRHAAQMDCVGSLHHRPVFDNCCGASPA